MAVINNTFTEIGDAAIVKAQLQINGIISFNDFSDVTGGEIEGRFFKREFRFSYDAVIYSDWFEILENSINTEVEAISNFLFIEFRYTREGSAIDGALTLFSINVDTLNSRSFLPKLQTLTNELYPTGWAWKNKLSDAQILAPNIPEFEYLISMKTIKDGLINLVVSYSGINPPIWTTTNQQKIGSNVDFIFSGDDAKEIFLFADEIDALDGSGLFTDLDLYELDLSRSKSDSNFVDPFDNKLRRFWGPISTVTNHIDFTFTGIEYLNFEETIFQNANIQLQKVNSLYAFIQPKAPWSVSNLTITDSTIFGTLNLNKLTIKGSLNIVDNWFIEGVAFSASADYSEALTINFDNCTLLKFVDFSIMNGLLQAENSTVIATQIGADQANVDAMLLALKNIAPNNAAPGRRIDLRRNAAPGTAGQIYKTQLQNIGITVDTE